MNNFADNKYRAFTTRFGGKTNVLLTKVHISLPYDPRIDKGKTPPAIRECRAIWDTGATNSVVTKQLAQDIGLIPTGKVQVTNTTTVELRNSYLLNVFLPSKVLIQYLKITECEDVLGSGDADMLIGMDVISMGDLAVTYENDNTVMSFIMPPINTIDYVHTANEANRKIDQFDKLQKEKQTRVQHQNSKKKIKAKRKHEKQNKKQNRKRGHKKHYE